jgi:hypothetical protein
MRQKEKTSCSLSRLVKRSIWKPHGSLEPGRKRSCENGMRISAVQPSESMLALPSQTGSQETSPLPPSQRPPTGDNANDASPLWL